MGWISGRCYINSFLYNSFNNKMEKKEVIVGGTKYLLYRLDTYNVGDKVLVRKDLQLKPYGIIGVVEDMLPLGGTLQIIDFIRRDNSEPVYRFKENLRNWTAGMIAGKLVTAPSPYKPKRDTKATNDLRKWCEKIERGKL